MQQNVEGRHNGKILKSQLATQFTIQKEYRADF